MRIVYVGQLWEGGTCRMRMEALVSLGHDVVGVDATPRRLTGRAAYLVARVLHRIGYPPDLTELNRRLVQAAGSGPPDVVWIDKGLVVEVETLRRLKAVSQRTRLVHYNPDDPFGHQGQARWRRFLHALPVYDVHFVARRENIDEYLARGAQTVLRGHWGFSPAVHRPITVSAKERRRLGGSVGFVGGCEDDRAGHLLALARARVPVRVWGHEGWSKWNARDPLLIVEGEPLWGDDYARAISSFDINLCFLRKANRDRQTTRTFEIPACGGFMLAERTDEHLELFDEGKEAEFFGSTEELVDKTRFYLVHDEARRRIAAAGRERCLRSGYDYPNRMRQMLEWARACAG